MQHHAAQHGEPGVGCPPGVPCGASPMPIRKAMQKKNWRNSDERGTDQLQSFSTNPGLPTLYKAQGQIRKRSSKQTNRGVAKE